MAEYLICNEETRVRFSLGPHNKTGNLPVLLCGICLKKSEPILRRTLKANADSAGRNNWLGIWICPASADFPPAGGVWGGMRASFGLGVFGKNVRANRNYCWGLTFCWACGPIKTCWNCLPHDTPCALSYNFTKGLTLKNPLSKI